METESKVWDVFDLLASKINGHLDYPELLVENSIHGNATLDLYFDSQGNVDERKSKTYGDNPFVRGLLIRATRIGFVEWYSSDAGRLRKEQFKNQHFRADFILAYSQEDSGALVKTVPGTYNFLRRRVSNITCLGKSPEGYPMFNAACAIAGIGGAIYRNVSDKYKSRLIAIKDNLEYYDSLELSGINAAAQRGT